MVRRKSSLASEHSPENEPFRSDHNFNFHNLSRYSVRRSFWWKFVKFHVQTNTSLKQGSQLRPISTKRLDDNFRQMCRNRLLKVESGQFIDLLKSEGNMDIKYYIKYINISLKIILFRNYITTRGPVPHLYHKFSNRRLRSKCQEGRKRWQKLGPNPWFRFF